MSTGALSVRLYWLRLDALPEDALSSVPVRVRDRCLQAVDSAVARRRVAAQAALRLVLAEETGVPPDRLRLLHGPHGKPELGDRSLHFNLSDSGGFAVVAVSREAPLGVDVERVRTVPRWRSLSRRMFGDSAEARLEALSPEERERAVIAAWCRYEAWTKARGTGLARAGRPPERLDLPMLPGGRVLPPTAESPSGWWLGDLVAPQGFLAALVVAGGRSATTSPGPPLTSLPPDVFLIT